MNTCTGDPEDIHGYLAGWVECGFCEFRHMGVLPACTVDFYDGNLQCPRCARCRGKYLGLLGETVVITTPWFPA